ncbi:MAG: hypothetical protein ACKOK7_06395 [Solirubrobacterales bacterium]
MSNGSSTEVSIRKFSFTLPSGASVTSSWN